MRFRTAIHVRSDLWVWLLWFLLPQRKWYREYYLSSVHWRTLRRKKLKAVGEVCERCGRKPTFFDVHHLTYERIWREHLTDLEVLCRSCHKKEHQK